MTDQAGTKFVDDKREASSFGFADLGYDPELLRVSTDRYRSQQFQEKEMQAIWQKVWQVAGRADELQTAGDWKEYAVGDQSYLITRDQQGQYHAFINACTHRGNKLCTAKRGSSKVLVCPFHRWTFNLDGSVRGITRPDLVGPVDTNTLGLVKVSVDTFAGFLFINPDPNAQALKEYLGAEVLEYLEPYHLDEMVPVGLNVREELECNWKVVVDAFQEGYHIQALHPQMSEVIVIDPSKSRYSFFGDHHLIVAPFEVRVDGFSTEQEIEGIKIRLPQTYHGAAEVMPLFEALVADYQDDDGKVTLPDGITPYTLLQRATRATLEKKGLEVSGLSDPQMTNHYGWLFFPNLFLSVKAGEATLTISTPHPDGDPNRCIWQVIRLAWLPEEQRAAARQDCIEVDPPGSFEYFLVLQQDYDQMPHQQNGLRNQGFTHMTLAQEEIGIGKFQAAVDRHINQLGRG